MESLPEQSPPAHGRYIGRDVILYDGVCALCDAMVKFVLPRDTKAHFMFAPLQSQFAHKILPDHGLGDNHFSTFYVVCQFGTPQEKILNRSRAAMYVLSRLDGIWRAFSILKIVPAPLADIVYNAVAVNRYKIFGKHDTCVVPLESYTSRFIEA